jgi:hypothetical protein
MIDDIMTRLRDNCGCSGTEQFGYTCISCVAADEIERLRAELQLAHSQIAIIATAEVEEEPF